MNRAQLLWNPSSLYRLPKNVQHWCLFTIKRLAVVANQILETTAPLLAALHTPNNSWSSEIEIII